MTSPAATIEPSLSLRASPPTILFWPLLAAGILLLKSALLGLDHTPMFYMGDSEAYLSTAFWNWVPPDRSFLYGWVIHWLTASSRSLEPLLAAQMLATAGAALLLAWALRRYFEAPRWLAALMAAACSLEPLQLLYERYVMTEAFSLLAFTLFVTFSLAYLKRPIAALLAAVQVAGLLLISFRVSFLPMVEAATLLLPPMTFVGRHRPTGPAGASSLINSRLPRLAAHLLLSLLLFVGLHSAYKRYYAAHIQHILPGAPPAYYYDNGFHLLAFVAPIAQPRDFPHPETADSVFHTAFDLKDPLLRIRQRWSEGGLIENLKAAYPDHLEANRLAEQTAWNAVKRDPLGELRLAMFAFGDYFNLDHLHHAMVSDRGADRDLSDDLLYLLRAEYGIDGRQLPYIATPTNRCYFAAWPWYLALLTLPAALLAMLWMVPATQRRAVLFLWLLASLQMAVIAACTVEPNVRFLHAMAWVGMLAIGIACTRIWARFRPKPPASRPLNA